MMTVLEMKKLRIIREAFSSSSSIYIWNCELILFAADEAKMLRHGRVMVAILFRTLNGAENQRACNASLADSTARGATATPAPLARLGLLLWAPTERWDRLFVCYGLPALMTALGQ